LLDEVIGYQTSCTKRYLDEMIKILLCRILKKAPENEYEKCNIILIKHLTLYIGEPNLISLN